MKAMAQLKSPLSPSEDEVIHNILSPIFNIQILDIDLGNGMLLFSYNGPIDLVMAEKKLMEAGLPVISYSFPNRIPLSHSGTDPDLGSLS